VILARGKRGQNAASRVQKVFQRSPCFRPLRDKYGNRLGEFLEGRVEVIDGDARKPLFGISEPLLDLVLEQLDAVVHVAGSPISTVTLVTRCR